MSEFAVDAASLIDWQTCRRKYTLSREWRLARWRPKLLFDTLLRAGIVQLCQGVKASVAASHAKAAFMQIAAQPGLDVVGSETYTLAREWCAMLDTVLHGVAKRELPVIHDPQSERLSSSLVWKLTSWADDSGALHRWLTVDQWDNESLAREVHSWRTIGDIVAAQVPMTLHVVSIGQYKSGRHASPWARAFRHPAMTSLKMQFVKPPGTTWKSSYFVEQHDMDAEEWVASAWKQGALQPLLVDVPIDVPSDSVCRDTVSQIAQEADAMQRLVGADYLSVPMSRGACDLYSVPCVYQNVCYQTEVVPVDKLGLYVPRKSSYSTRQEEVPAT